MPDEMLLQANKIAVMSDVHLAAGDCVLDRPDQDGIGGLTRFLDENGVKVDVFVLLGDVFDLAMATYSDTTRRAKRLVQVLAGHCAKIVYVPGNHDHHMWLLANDSAEIVEPFPNCPPGFAPRAERSYAKSFLQQIDVGHPFEVSYPNAYWKPPKGSGRAFVMHHGHFCEDTYTLVSDIYHDAFEGSVKDLNAIESINAGWVEFVWYHLGQGGVGVHGLVEALYNQIKSGKTDSLDNGIRALYTKKVSPLVHQALADQAKKHWWLPNKAAAWAADAIDSRAPGWMMDAVKRAITSHLRDGSPGVSAMRGSPLDEALATHCKRYLELTSNSRSDLGTQLSLIFGHTHSFGVWPLTQPFLFNDGGWIGDDKSWPDAYLFVVDEAANVRALHFGLGGKTIGRAVYPPA
ncbi:MAG: metallophosphoesterase [Polyangia bacterium]